MAFGEGFSAGAVMLALSHGSFISVLGLQAEVKKAKIFLGLGKFGSIIIFLAFR